MSRLILGFALALAGCVIPSQTLKPGYVPPKIVAVLPMNNETTDLNGPVVVRYWFDERLQEKKGYTTVPLETVDAGLNDLGITMGSQLDATTPQKIGEKLGADAVIYGDLETFAYQTTGFINVKRVKAHFKMVDCKTGETLWEAEGNGANSTAGGPSEALKLGLTQLGSQIAEKAADSPLRTETWDMIWNAIEYLPPAH